MSKLLLATVAAIGLLLAGPQKASAQTVFACVSSAANSPIIIEPTADAPCPPSAGGQTWTKITLSQTPGPIAARQYNCDRQEVIPGRFVTFTDGGIGFGTTLPTPIGPFTSFLLQPGFYQASFSTFYTTPATDYDFDFRPFSPVPMWHLLFPSGTISGDRLFSVTTANTSAFLQLVGTVGESSPATLGLSCVLVLTQLH